MVLRLTQGSPDGKISGGHQVVGFAKDPNPERGVPGITTVDSLEKMVAAARAAEGGVGHGPGGRRD